MELKPLDDDFVDALLVEPAIRKAITHECVCGSPLEMGYCRNPECEWDAIEETFPCEWCGCCPDPKHCVWSVTCPICKTAAKQPCREGTKLVGLHQERWDLSGSTWERIYDKTERKGDEA